MSNLSQEIPAERFVPDTSNLSAALKYVEQRCADLGASRQQTSRLLVITDELFVNSIHHGKSHNAPLELSLTSDGHEITLTFSDSTEANNPFGITDFSPISLPTEERPVGGLGVLLVRALARDVQYTRLESSNRITIIV